MSPAEVLRFVREHSDPLLAIGLLVGLGFAGWYLLGVLTPFLLALVLAYVLEPLVRGMTRFGLGVWKPDRPVAVMIVFVLLASIFFGFGIPLAVNLARGLVHIAGTLEGADLQAEAATLATRYRALIESIPLPADLRAQLTALAADPRELASVVVPALEQVRALASTVLRGGAGFLSAAFSAGFQLLFVPVVLFYVLLEYPTIGPMVRGMVPVPYRAWTDSFFVRVDRSLGGFLRGQLLIAFLFGTIMTIGLWMIGIRYAIVLGPVSGLANLVPYLGVVVGLVPSLFLALWQGGFGLESLRLAGLILLLFVLIQTLDGYVFQPKILGPSVELHPLAIMLSLAIGEHLMGLAGMMLAVPVAAVLRVILEDLYPVLYRTGAEGS